MGGSASDFAKMEANIFEPGVTRKMLTPYALRTIAHADPDVLPDISTESIMEKSKANPFAKCLSCLQASWFPAQVIGRVITSHAIGLLELNVVLHALCCLMIYVVWWNKTLDIDEPF